VNNACATSTAKADKLPLHMVVVFDRSGSMCIYNENNPSSKNCNDPSSRWQQVKNAMISFFGAQDSAGITTSLITFSQSGIIYQNLTIPASDCQASTYTTPSVANVSLPDTGSQLANKLNSMTGSGGTPTRYALEGAVQYAQGVQTQMGGNGKVVLVLATDGTPEFCDSNANSVSSTAAIAAGVASTIPTYVIGVGDQLTSLNQLAQSGGTQSAFIVSTQNGQVGAQFSAAMDAIRGASLGCEYAIPAPPAGQTLDFGKVNVQFTATGGSPTTLTYSADCSNASGWHYDDANAPKKILLCQGACDTAKADSGGKVDVVLGCQTVGGVN
jgi:hypothetical protein